MSCRLSMFAKNESWTPEEYFINAIIESGITDHDIPYFSSNTFYWHCDLLGYDSDVIGAVAISAIKHDLFK